MDSRTAEQSLRIPRVLRPAALAAYAPARYRLKSQLNVSGAGWQVNTLYHFGDVADASDLLGHEDPVVR